jgi:hypothetical protein
MKLGHFARSALVLVVLLGVLSQQPVDAAAGGRKRKAKAKGKKKSESAGLASGATPAGNTDWKSDSLGSISVKVKTSHLNLHKSPAFFTSLTTSSRRPLLDAGLTGAKALIEDVHMANVTGSNQPKRASADGFMLRMRYPKEDGRNLTTTSARLNSWRVKWVAVTDESPLLKSLEGLETEEERVDGRVSPTVAYVRLLRQLVMENPVMVNGLLGKEYELPESKQPKAKPAKKKASAGEKKKGGDDASASASTEGEDGKNADDESAAGDESDDASAETGDDADKVDEEGGEDDADAKEDSADDETAAAE